MSNLAVDSELLVFYFLYPDLGYKSIETNDLSSKHQYFCFHPVLPNPPAPLTLASNSSTTSISGV